MSEVYYYTFLLYYASQDGNHQNVIHTVANRYFNQKYIITKQVIFEFVNEHLCEKFDNYSIFSLYSFLIFYNYSYSLSISMEKLHT